MLLIRCSVECGLSMSSWEIYTFLLFYAIIVQNKTKKSFTAHMYMFFSEMNDSLAMVDRAEIEQLELFLKEKAQQQMTLVIIQTSTLH